MNDELKTNKVGMSLAEEVAARGRPGRSHPRPRAAPRRDGDLEQRVIYSHRVTRVVAGGRRFSVALVLAVGDRRGSVGLGTGKARDTQLAMAKALRAAKKSMFKIPLTGESSVAHEVAAKFGSAKVKIMPNGGRGLVAGSSARDLLHLAGVKNVTAKIISGGKSRLNNARVVLKALHLLKPKTLAPSP